MYSIIDEKQGNDCRQIHNVNFRNVNKISTIF